MMLEKATYMHFRHWRVEGFIREEEQRAAEHDARVVARLQRRDQNRLAADSVGVLLHLHRNTIEEMFIWNYNM